MKDTEALNVAQQPRDTQQVNGRTHFWAQNMPQRASGILITNEYKDAAVFTEFHISGHFLWLQPSIGQHEKKEYERNLRQGKRWQKFWES